MNRHHSRPADLEGILDGIRAITFDFGNTLVPVAGADLARVVAMTMERLDDRSGPFDRAELERAWTEERDRQFAEEVPAFREVELPQRVVRVLARLRGMPRPAPGARWDDTAAAACSTPEEVAAAVEAYSAAFVAVMPVPADRDALLARLASRYRLAVLSNWPPAATIDAFLEAAGWRRHLTAVVVSERVGTIKPHPRIFRIAEEALGVPAHAILHVGDDWAADVVGAKRAGWRAAYVRERPTDSPLPGSDPNGEVEPDLVLERLGDLPVHLAPRWNEVGTRAARPRSG